MNRSVVIAVISLLVGLALGLGLAQVLGGAGQRDGGANGETLASASSSAVSATSSAQPAEKIEPQGLSAENNASLPGEDSGEVQGENAQDSAGSGNASSAVSTPAGAVGVSVDEDGTYTSKDEVAVYIHTFGHLPSNYISKTKARNAGWVSKEGNLHEVLPGMSIGGSEFYNDEGLLPDAPGRTWTECDINYAGGYRGAERIVFSNDGLIFYTADHYETFEQLY